MQADHELVRDHVGIDRPFDVKTTYTNEFLDRKIRMTKWDRLRPSPGVRPGNVLHSHLF